MFSNVRGSRMPAYLSDEVFREVPAVAPRGPHRNYRPPRIYEPGEA